MTYLTDLPEEHPAHDITFTLATVRPRTRRTPAPTRLGADDPQPSKPGRHPGPARSDLLRPARLARTGHHRGHPALRRRAGLPEHAWDLHSGSYRGLVTRRRRRP